MDPPQRRILVSCLASYFMSIAMVYQMAPFFQRYAEQKAGASNAQVGLIFAMLPLASFVCSLPAGRLVAFVGERTALTAGLLLLSGSSLAFGLSESVAAWLIWRSVQGAAAAPIYTSISSLLAKTFTGQGEFAKVNGWQEAAANLGFVLSPVLGGVLFQWGGFVAPFAVSAGGHLCFLTFAAGALPPKTSGEMQEPLCGADSRDGLAEVTIATASLFEVCHAELLWMAAAGVLVPCIFGAFDPVLASHFKTCLGDIQDSTVGTLMAISALPSTLGAVAVSRLPSSWPPAYIVAAGFVLMAASTLLYAVSDPSANVMDLSCASTSQWVLQLCSALGLGAAVAAAWTPVLPDMINTAATKVAEARCESQPAVAAVSATVASVFNAGAAIGEAMGPIAGAGLTAKIGFAGTFTLLAFGLFAFGIMLMSVQCSRTSTKADGVHPEEVPQLRLRAASGLLGEGELAALAPTRSDASCTS